MKINILLLGLLLFYSCNNIDKTKNSLKDEQLMSIQPWFQAWELVNSEVLKIQPKHPPLFLFYDNEYLYVNAEDYFNNGAKVKGPSFFGKELSWYREKHADTITLPTNEKLPINLMSFAGTYGEYPETPFFIMALPSFWKAAQVKSEQLGDENLYVNVFLHEFSHTQQNRAFFRKIDSIEKLHEFEFELTDDMIQLDMGRDSIYNQIMNTEIKLLYEAFESKEMDKTIELLTQAIDNYNKRQQQFFINEKEVFRQLDDYFLTFEGMGQYIAYTWLVHPKGGNLDIKKVLEGIRRGGRWWTQDEGLALFLVYNKISNSSLGKEMFGTDELTIKNLLENKLLYISENLTE